MARGEPRRRVSFKTVGLSLACLAIFVAALNLYMNVMASYSIPSLQLDLSADGDIIGFHQFDLVSPVAEQVYQQRKQKRLSDFASDTGLNPKHLAHFAKEKATEERESSPKQDCVGLCSPPGSLQTQPNYVKALVDARMKLVPRNSFSVEIPQKTETLLKPPSLMNFAEIWNEISAWISDRTITPDSLYSGDKQKLGGVIDAVASAKIQEAYVPLKGTQLKAGIILEGKQHALWKPQRYGRNESVPSDTPYAGADRHNGEIAAFHLSLMLGLNRVPIAVGRKLNLKEELYELGNPGFQQAFFNNSKQQLCFYGKCLYCKPEEAVCASSTMEGTVVLWMGRQPYESLGRVRSPWARTYDDRRTAPWETDANYCASVKQHTFFGSAPVFLDLIDMAVFDWLIGNADRHRLEYFESSSVKKKMILLLDNGKSFGNAGLDEISILAPLYQCCQIRSKLYHRLIRYSEENFGALLNEHLRMDPLYPVLSAPHLEALNRRIRKVLVVLAACIEKHGESYVLKEDGF